MSRRLISFSVSERLLGIRSAGIRVLEFRGGLGHRDREVEGKREGDR